MINYFMITKLHYLFLPLLISFTITTGAPTKSNQSCGPHTLPYPFGFSPDSPIRLNCTPQNDVVIGKFQVHTVTEDSILITLKANCSRPINSIRDLFSNNFAPTSRNALLLRGCSTGTTSTFMIPTTLVQTRFEERDCRKSKRGGSSISCYSELKREKDFMDYTELMGSGCKSLFSAISTGTVNDTVVVSLQVQVLELGWWLQGPSQCDKNGNSSRVVSPLDGRLGYRCHCLTGFEGDGYRAGLGCRKVSSRCNASKYISGNCGGTTKVGILIGGVAAGATLMVSIGLLCCLIRHGFTLKASNKSIRELSEATGTCIPIYPYKEIQKATNNFSEENRLGTGAYGTVYLGKLYKGELVAIKRIKHYDGCIERVVNEIKLLSSVQHPNLVRLLGCSIDKREQILVYEFMPNGTLCQHLQRERGDGLSWPIRLRIAIETAQSIAYLHSSVHPPIYHRDIKSSNILLDHNFKSKVADFGLSRLGLPGSSHISTAPQGTPGYLDPQYHQDFHLSDKSDVYSFGVVLVEIITGLKVVDFSRPQNEVNLAALATDTIGSGRLFHIIDPILSVELNEKTLSSIHNVGELAFRCLAFHRDMRPSMTEVASELVQIGLYVLKPTRPSHVEVLSRKLLSPGDFTTVNEELSTFGRKRMRRNSLGFYIMQTREEFTSSVDLEEDFPVSVQDTWSSEQSSPSSNGLLVSVIHST